LLHDEKESPSYLRQKLFAPKHSPALIPTMRKNEHNALNPEKKQAPIHNKEEKDDEESPEYPFPSQWYASPAMEKASNDSQKNKSAPGQSRSWALQDLWWKSCPKAYPAIFPFGWHCKAPPP